MLEAYTRLCFPFLEGQRVSLLRVATINEVMRKVSGLQSIADPVKAELFLRLLDSLEEAQTTANNRTYVGNLRQKLQQKQASKRGKKKATVQVPSGKPSWSSSENEQDLSTADSLEPSYRCIPRILCAGTGVNAVQDAPKEKCLKVMERLLGPYWILAPIPFPPKGGRLFIARVLSYILQRHVSLMDIKKWFYIPNSGKMSISEELSMALRERGVTWPPNVDGFRECTAVYNPSVQGCQGAAAPSAAVVDWYPNAGAHLASLPQGLACICPETRCFLSELGEEASSSSSSSSDRHRLQRTAMAFPEGSAEMLTDADHMQRWPLPADCMLPSWEPNSVLNLPSISSGTDLEMYGSGVSSDEICDMQYISIFGSL